WAPSRGRAPAPCSAQVGSMAPTAIPAFAVIPCGLACHSDCTGSCSRDPETLFVSFPRKSVRGKGSERSGQRSCLLDGDRARSLVAVLLRLLSLLLSLSALCLSAGRLRLGSLRLRSTLPPRHRTCDEQASVWQLQSYRSRRSRPKSTSLFHKRG